MQNENQNRRAASLRYTKVGLAVLALLVYGLFVTGDYFLPVKSPLWLWGAVAGLGLAIGLRLYLVYRLTRQDWLAWLKIGWPILLLLVASGVGGFLRWQTVRTTALAPAETDFAAQALLIITHSDWKPKSFMQPPLYLYLTALVGQLQFVQQAGAGKLASPDGLTASGLAESMRYVNLLLGLITLIPVYATARQLWSPRIGAVAASLLATSWLAYQSTAAQLAVTLGGLLAAMTLFFMVRAYQTGTSSSFAVSGLGLGLASAAAYGAVGLLLPLGLTLIWQPTARLKKAGVALAGLLAGFSLGAPGWILSFNLFASGLAAIGRAPNQAAAFYLRQSFTNDAGLAVVFGLAVLLGLARRAAETQKLWLLLAFPLAHSSGLAWLGPLQLERLALISPIIAMAATQPLGLIANFVQRKLDQHDDRHKWGESTVLVALVVVVVLASVLVRRLLA